MKAELHAHIRKYLKKYCLMFLEEFTVKGAKRVLHLYERDALIPRSTPMNVLSFAQIKPGVLVLDVGCGDGLSLKFYQRHGARGIGLEISKIRARRVKALGEAIIADAMHLPFHEKVFDVVIASEILEHLTTPSLGLEEASRVLKETGKIILNIPNDKAFLLFRLMNLSQIWKLVFYRGQHHYYIASLNGMKEMLRKTGFDIKRIKKEEREWSSLFGLTRRKEVFHWILEGKKRCTT